MRGIILAGGHGTRLRPMTSSVSKQLLPIFDKPMVYYPISTLMLAGISEILVISTPEDIDNYRELLGDGSRFGLGLEYVVQKKPGGLAQALILGEDFIEGECCALILGDNLFHGEDLSRLLKQSVSEIERNGGSHLFAIRVDDPSRFGIAEVDSDGSVISIVEKPKRPKSDLAVTGLYIYDSSASMRANTLSSSSRGELEITDLNMTYVLEGSASLIALRDVKWLDTGTPDSLHSACSYVQEWQTENGKMIGCLEEIGWKMGFLEFSQLSESVGDYPLGNSYGDYVRSLEA
jgi:glucose-1-phosphate thymidylyltransferase